MRVQDLEGFILELSDSDDYVRSRLEDLGISSNGTSFA